MYKDIPSGLRERIFFVFSALNVLICKLDKNESNNKEKTIPKRYSFDFNHQTEFKWQNEVVLPRKNWCKSDNLHLRPCLHK